jgi:hypothetical protein
MSRVSVRDRHTAAQPTQSISPDPLGEPSPRSPYVEQHGDVPGLVLFAQMVGHMMGVMGRWWHIATEPRESLELETQVPIRPAQAGVLDMPKKADRVTLAERNRWLQRRDAHLARIRTDPARVASSDAHVDVAIFEDWLDGQLSDEYVEDYMRKHPDCERCQAVYERYKSLKTTPLLHRR